MITQWCRSYGLLGVKAFTEKGLEDDIDWRTFFAGRRDDPPAGDLESAHDLLFAWNRYENYGEKLDEFLRFARAFQSAVASLADSSDQSGRSFLEKLLTPARPQLGIPWNCPTLLTQFALMVREDLDQGRRIIKCQNCETPALVLAYQARYCTDRCRRAYQTRHYLARKKEPGK